MDWPRTFYIRILLTNTARKDFVCPVLHGGFAILEMY